jgi:hypothetical protein
MKTFILSVLTAATLALAGCAVDPTSPGAEDDDATQQAFVTGDHANLALGVDVGVGGRGGVTVASDPSRRMVDFDKTPRIAERAPYEANLAEINALGAVPHAATASDDDFQRRPSANVDTSGPKP